MGEPRGRGLTTPGFDRSVNSIIGPNPVDAPTNTTGSSLVGSRPKPNLMGTGALVVAGQP